MKRLGYAKSSWSLALRQWPTVLMTALTAAILTGCKDDLGYETVNGIYAPKGEITFYSSFDSQQREPMTRHMGHLSVEEEEWELTGLNSEAGDSLDNGKGSTRVDASEDLSGYFANAGVKIFLYDGTWGSGATGRAIPSDATSLHGTFNSDGLLSPAQSILWTQAKKDASNYYAHMRAYAFGPLAAGGSHPAAHSITSLIASGNATFNPGAMNTRPTITYTVPDAPADQADLIAGYTGELDGDYGVQDGNSSAVPMTFRHVLSAIQFKIGFGCWVKSIKIEGVYKKGTGYIDDDGNAVVTPDASAGTYSYTYNFTANGSYTICTEEDGEITSPAGGLLTSGDLTLMMIPQTLPSGAKVTLKYSTDSGANYQDLVCSLEGYEWQPGYRYTYVIKEKPSYSVYFDLAAAPVMIYSDGSKYVYSGSVYVNGVVTPVTGEHLPENKYYVYQSTGDVGGNYDKDHTGWATTVGTGTCRIPNYESVKSPNGIKEWGDYVTDNTSSSIITEWPTQATAVGRTSTDNNIRVFSNAALGNLDVDLTVDNIWQTSDESATSANKYNGLATYQATGMFFLNNVGSVKCYEYERITLRLKGYNKVSCVAFRGYHSEQTDESNRAFLKITSYYGDNSKKGALCVLPQSTTQYYKSDGQRFPTTRIGGQNLSSDANYENRRCNGISFDGGTVYACNPPYTDTFTAYSLFGCVGAGSNTPAIMDFNGGRLTCVAYCSSAAFGGGSGMSSTGSSATLSITGGELYAYQFGTINSYNHGLQLGAAIGGGGSYGGRVSKDASDKTIVNITGGFVKAVSIGANAIGGGPSMKYNGGNARVVIGGNAKVYAKSISGSVFESPTVKQDVSYSTSIGGGGAGNASLNWTTSPEGKGTPDGGNAEIVIKDNAYVVFGSGGGGYSGKKTNGQSGLLGNAQVTIEGSPTIQGQFVMADPDISNPSSLKPSFHMSGGNIKIIDPSYNFVRQDGGCVWMNSGSCIIDGGSITNFGVKNGGAIYMEGGTFTMNGGTIKNCSASGSGGAVYINDATGGASVNMSGGTIQNCFADSHGGAIFLNGGSVIMSDGTITSCKATNSGSVDACGGGIYVNNGGFTMTGGNFIDNACKTDGAGIYVGQTNKAVAITGGTITGNVSENNGGGICVIPGDGNSVTVTIGTLGNNSTPLIDSNTAIISGGGLYAEGSGASVVINGGTIRDNIATSYVYNSDVANEGGVVTLNGGIVNHITIKFMPGAGNASWTEPKNYDIVSSTNSYLTTPTITRPNFTFVGWRVDTDGDGVGDGELLRYTGDKFSVDSSTGTVVTGSEMKFMNYRKDVTLVAQWQLGS